MNCGCFIYILKAIYLAHLLFVTRINGIFFFLPFPFFLVSKGINIWFKYVFAPWFSVLLP